MLAIMRLRRAKTRVNSQDIWKEGSHQPILRARRLTPAGFACLPDRHEVVSRSYRIWETIKVATGTVKGFNATKGYGFIQPSNGSKGLFVQISAGRKT